MDESQKPLFSRLEEDPHYREEIDEFIVGLAERIDDLQDVEGAGDLPAIGSLAENLRAEADRMGFPALRDAAFAVASAAAAGKAEDALQALEAVTDLSRRIRLGHRGAF